MTPNGPNTYYKHWFGGWLYDKEQFNQRNYPVAFHMDARICLLLCKTQAGATCHESAEDV